MNKVSLRRGGMEGKQSILGKRDGTEEIDWVGEKLVSYFAHLLGRRLAICFN